MFGKPSAPVAPKEEGQRVVKSGDVWAPLSHRWILCLHEAEILESIYILCKNSGLVALWKSQQHSPQMKKCPELRKSLGFWYPSQLPLPLALHGDGAPFLEHGSIQVLSMRCLLTKRIARHLLQSISQRLELKQKRCVHSKSLLTQAVRPKAPPS